MANKDIREAIERKRVRHYEVASAMRVSPSYFSCLLRTELSPEKKAEIMRAIESIKL